ncbi:sirohydrochlorin chelatase [Granulicella arctica]|uniref:Sirohydrochlorin ferrochelatase n=1 Tax=Granulicella arctica TaxID=940613 RepID=A0A7Y9PI38_9BACT|nr:CbiX/SirB N-terminal domain-containing protein [Granulicella arctica]NYF80330.1 sirohydrochlorin ferrochelatase [Granulicella arctica]
MKKILLKLMVLVCLPSMGLAQSSNSASTQAQHKEPREGVLLLAHGGSAQEWNEEVRHVADQVDLTMPTEVAFGMATRSTMQTAINRLVARGVTEIVAVPLFVSSHSSVIDSTAYLLGLRSQKPEDLKMFASMDHGGGMVMAHGAMMREPSTIDEAEKAILSPVPIHMASALDHHQFVADILRDRASSISRDPANEVVILVAHGPVPDDENKLWLNDMGLLAEQIGKQTQYAGIEYLTLRDDAEEPVRNAATQLLREKAEQITKEGKTVLIVPLLLSYGGIEDGLRKRLSGISYRMPAQALLPDERIVSWVIDTASNKATNSAVTAAQR